MNAPARAPAIRSRLPDTGTTIFTVMSALAARHGAVNLGQGFPDYPIDPALIDLVAAAMRAGHNQYPLMTGVQALREAIAGKVERLYGRAYDPEREVTVTTGATQAIFTAIGALAHPGDEVIVFEPAYDSYVPAVRLAGATPVTLPLAVPGYRIDWERTRAAVTPRTRLIVVNTPNNPGTSVLAPGDLDALKKKARVREEALAEVGYDDRDKIPYQFNVDGWIDGEIYKQMIEKVITALGQRGKVVITGRGGQCILKNSPKALHLRIVAETQLHAVRAGADCISHK